MNNELQICAITWNMHGNNITNITIETLFSPFKSKDIDMYIISTQECTRNIINSVIWLSDEETNELENKVLTYLNKDIYSLVNAESLGAIHIMLIIKKSLITNISSTGSHKTPTGILNIIGDKGSSCIWIKYNQTAMLFINCHLSSFQNNYLQQNDLTRIINDITIENANEIFDVNDMKTSSSSKSIVSNIFNTFMNKKEMNILKGKEVIEKVDLCMLMGDFNSRSDIDHSVARAMLLNKDIDKILYVDQLNKGIQTGEVDMCGFVEEKIKFYPTYKVKESEETENEGNENGYLQYLEDDDEDHVPSYTDRIFYKVRKGKGIVVDENNKEYYSNLKMMVSDHKPVYLVMKVKVI